MKRAMNIGLMLIALMAMLPTVASAQTGQTFEEKLEARKQHCLQVQHCRIRGGP
jgi:hypothetical protein